MSEHVPEKGAPKGNKTPTYEVPNEFFELKGPGSCEGNWVYTCKKCINKSISGGYKSRANLRAHVRSTHTRSLDWFNTACAGMDKRKRPATTNTAEEACDPEAGCTQPKLSTLSFQRKLTQKDLDVAIVNYLGKGVLPFHHVESEAFKAFIEILSPGLKVKTAQTYERKAMDQLSELKIRLISAMSDAPRVCLTADHWSAHRKGYIGLTAHWMSVNDLSRHSACIALRRVCGRVSYDVIANLINNIIDEYGLSGKVSHIVTDSGSNFIKAFQEFSGCTQGNLENSGEPNTQAESTSTDDICAIELDLSHQGSDEEAVILPAHFRCAVHKLSLVATKDADRALVPGSYKQVLRSLNAKLSCVWTKQSHSTKFSDQVKSKLGSLFVTPNATRWNATYDGLVRVKQFMLNKEVELRSLFVEQKLQPINATEKDFLIEYVSVMEPLAHSIDILQGDTATIGYLLPTIKTIQQEWVALSTGNLKYCGHLISVLQNSLCERFEHELKSEDLKVASALHPLFKDTWLQNDDVNELHALMMNALARFDVDVCAGTTNCQASDEQSKDRSFFWRFRKPNQPSSANTMYSIWLSWIGKLEENVPTKLHKAYAYYNTTLASSAPLERLFSLGKRVLSPLHTNLSDDHFECLVMLTSAKNM